MLTFCMRSDGKAKMTRCLTRSFLFLVGLLASTPTFAGRSRGEFSRAVRNVEVARRIIQNAINANVTSTPQNSDGTLPTTQVDTGGPGLPVRLRGPLSGVPSICSYAVRCKAPPKGCTSIPDLTEPCGCGKLECPTPEDNPTCPTPVCAPLPQSIGCIAKPTFQTNGCPGCERLDCEGPCRPRPGGAFASTDIMAPNGSLTLDCTNGGTTAGQSSGTAGNSGNGGVTTANDGGTQSGSGTAGSGGTGTSGTGIDEAGDTVCGPKKGTCPRGDRCDPVDCTTTYHCVPGDLRAPDCPVVVNDCPIPMCPLQPCSQGETSTVSTFEWNGKVCPGCASCGTAGSGGTGTSGTSDESCLGKQYGATCGNNKSCFACPGDNNLACLVAPPPCAYREDELPPAPENCTWIIKKQNFALMCTPKYYDDQECREPYAGTSVPSPEAIHSEDVWNVRGRWLAYLLFLQASKPERIQAGIEAISAKRRWGTLAKPIPAPKTKPPPTTPLYQCNLKVGSFYLSQTYGNKYPVISINTLREDRTYCQEERETVAVVNGVQVITTSCLVRTPFPPQINSSQGMQYQVAMAMGSTFASVPAPADLKNPDELEEKELKLKNGNPDAATALEKKSLVELEQDVVVYMREKDVVEQDRNAKRQEMMQAQMTNPSVTIDPAKTAALADAEGKLGEIHAKVVRAQSDLETRKTELTYAQLEKTQAVERLSDAAAQQAALDVANRVLGLDPNGNSLGSTPGTGLAPSGSSLGTPVYRAAAGGAGGGTPIGPDASTIFYQTAYIGPSYHGTGSSNNVGVAPGNTMSNYDVTGRIGVTGDNAPPPPPGNTNYDGIGRIGVTGDNAPPPPPGNTNYDVTGRIGVTGDNAPPPGNTNYDGTGIYVRGI